MASNNVQRGPSIQEHPKVKLQALLVPRPTAEPVSVVTGLVSIAAVLIQFLGG